MPQNRNGLIKICRQLNRNISFVETKGARGVGPPPLISTSWTICCALYLANATAKLHLKLNPIETLCYLLKNVSTNENDL